MNKTKGLTTMSEFHVPGDVPDELIKLILTTFGLQLQEPVR